MDLFSDLIAAVQSDLTVGSESTLYNPTTIKLAINRAYRKAGGLFRWPETEDALKTSTLANQQYYDYPENWKPNSVWRVEIDSERYGEEPDGSPITFNDFLNWKQDNPDSTDKKWATQWRRFFVSPTPTSAGNNNIVVWGVKVVEQLVNDTDTTIFSYTLPECNDAIVQEAVAILKAKGEQESSAMFHSAQALQILTTAFNKIKQEQAKYEKIQPMFNVPDYFSNTAQQVKDNIGDF